MPPEACLIYETLRGTSSILVGQMIEWAPHGASWQWLSVILMVLCRWFKGGSDGLPPLHLYGWPLKL